MGCVFTVIGSRTDHFFLIRALRPSRERRSAPGGKQRARAPRKRAVPEPLAPPASRKNFHGHEDTRIDYIGNFCRSTRWRVAFENAKSAPSARHDGKRLPVGINHVKKRPCATTREETGGIIHGKERPYAAAREEPIVVDGNDWLSRRTSTRASPSYRISDAPRPRAAAPTGPTCACGGRTTVLRIVLPSYGRRQKPTAGVENDDSHVDQHQRFLRPTSLRLYPPQVGRYR